MKTKSLLDAYHQVHLKPTTKNVCGTALDTADLDTKRISLSEAYSNMPSAPKSEADEIDQTKRIMKTKDQTTLEEAYDRIAETVMVSTFDPEDNEYAKARKARKEFSQASPELQEKLDQAMQPNGVVGKTV